MLTRHHRQSGVFNPFLLKMRPPGAIFCLDFEQFDVHQDNPWVAQSASNLFLWDQFQCELTHHSCKHVELKLALTNQGTLGFIPPPARCDMKENRAGEQSSITAAWRTLQIPCSLAVSLHWLRSLPKMWASVAIPKRQGELTLSKQERLIIFVFQHGAILCWRIQCTEASKKPR